MVFFDQSRISNHAREFRTSEDDVPIIFDELRKLQIWVTCLSAAAYKENNKIKRNRIEWNERTVAYRRNSTIYVSKNGLLEDSNRAFT